MRRQGIWYLRQAGWTPPSGGLSQQFINRRLACTDFCTLAGIVRKQLRTSGNPLTYLPLSRDFFLPLHSSHLLCSIC
jgi:hypothetical protein